MSGCRLASHGHVTSFPQRQLSDRSMAAISVSKTSGDNGIKILNQGKFNNVEEHKDNEGRGLSLDLDLQNKRS